MPEPTVIVVGGQSEQAPAQAAPEPAPEPAETIGEAVQLGAVLESNRQLSDLVRTQAERLEAIEARERERASQLDTVISRLSEPEPEPEVTLVTPEPEPAAEPEPEPEKQGKECPRWLKPILGER